MLQFMFKYTNTEPSQSNPFCLNPQLSLHAKVLVQEFKPTHVFRKQIQRAWSTHTYKATLNNHVSRRCLNSTSHMKENNCISIALTRWVLTSKLVMAQSLMALL